MSRARSATAFVPTVAPKCKTCSKSVYAAEQLQYDNAIYHQECFRCNKCNSRVTLVAVAMISGVLYCKPCFKKVFAERGKYADFAALSPTAGAAAAAGNAAGAGGTGPSPGISPASGPNASSKPPASAGAGSSTTSAKPAAPAPKAASPVPISTQHVAAPGGPGSPVSSPGSPSSPGSSGSGAAAEPKRGGVLSRVAAWGQQNPAATSPGAGSGPERRATVSTAPAARSAFEKPKPEADAPKPQEKPKAVEEKPKADVAPKAAAEQPKAATPKTVDKPASEPPSKPAGSGDPIGTSAKPPPALNQAKLPSKPAGDGDPYGRSSLRPIDAGAGAGAGAGAAPGAAKNKATALDSLLSGGSSLFDGVADADEPLFGAASKSPAAADPDAALEVRLTDAALEAPAAAPAGDATPTAGDAKSKERPTAADKPAEPAAEVSSPSDAAAAKLESKAADAKSEEGGSDNEVIFETTFAAMSDKLTWLNEPKRFSVGDCLRVEPDAKTDFWNNTYYSPTLLAHSGHALLFRAEEGQDLVAECEFQLSPKQQFDQGGLMVHVDKDHWMKCGIEVVDGKPRFSVVVTNSGFSDWSTQAWHSNSATVRVYKLKDNLVVEKVEGKGKGEAEFVRIAHLAGGGGACGVGVFTCAPTGAGLVSEFRRFSVRKTKGHPHKN